MSFHKTCYITSLVIGVIFGPGMLMFYNLISFTIVAVPVVVISMIISAYFDLNLIIVTLVVFGSTYCSASLFTAFNFYRLSKNKRFSSSCYKIVNIAAIEFTL